MCRSRGDRRDAACRTGHCHIHPVADARLGGYISLNSPFLVRSSQLCGGVLWARGCQRRAVNRRRQTSAHQLCADSKARILVLEWRQQSCTHSSGREREALDCARACRGAVQARHYARLQLCVFLCKECPANVWTVLRVAGPAMHTLQDSATKRRPKRCAEVRARVHACKYNCERSE